MRDRRVIYDSEEEDEGFSPLNSPAKADTALVVTTAEDDTEGQFVDRQTGDSRSTDPDFFKRIYEEQQKAVAGSVPDSMRDTQAQNGSSDKLKSPSSKANKNNSSSITDPTLRSSRKRALGNIATRDLANFTQVTTPSAPSAKQKDVYDFTLSDEDEEGAAGPAISHSTAKSTRTSSKRQSYQSVDSHPNPAPAIVNPPQLSTSSQGIQDHEDESMRPRKKKRNSARDQSMRRVPNDVDLLVNPATADLEASEPLDETQMDHGGLGPDSVASDTRDMQIASYDRPPASFFIDPPDVLTSSQKQQYLRVSGSSDLDREENQQQASLPMQDLAQTQGQRPPSTSVSTIAYTTPSRYASSVAPLPILGTFEGRSSNGATSGERKTQSDKTQPHSSPDELNTLPTARTYRGKRLMSAVDEEDELAQHDLWDSDKIGYSREACVPSSSRRRPGLNQDSPRETLAEHETSTARRKRQKRRGPIERAPEEAWGADKVEVDREHYAPRPSRRRLRVLVEEEDEEIQHLEQSMPDTCPPGDADYRQAGDAGPAAISYSQQAPDQATEGIKGVDPEFWAAMPEDIRQELMSQQQSDHTSQAPRPRRSGRAGEAMSSVLPIQEEKVQPKKRGRKKKEPTIEQTSDAFDEPAAAIDDTEARPSPAPNVTAKRKRGRPRKAEVELPPPSSEIDETASVAETPKLSSEATKESNATHASPEKPLQDVAEALKVPAKRGRKKKAVEATPAQLKRLEEIAHAEQEGKDTVEGTGELAVEPSHFPMDAPEESVEIEDRKALRDISNTASNVDHSSAMEPGPEKLSTDDVEQQQEEVTPEPRAKKVPKSASTPGQQGKVPLRVGLSKKSRIAPLLKVIRK